MTRADVALALQRALLGEVSPSLRGVGADLTGSKLGIWFYFDAPVSEEDRESASSTLSEVAADLASDVELRSDIVRIDSPAPLPDRGIWVYRRRE